MNRFVLVKAIIVASVIASCTPQIPPKPIFPQIPQSPTHHPHIPPISPPNHSQNK